MDQNHPRRATELQQRLSVIPKLHGKSAHPEFSKARIGSGQVPF